MIMRRLRRLPVWHGPVRYGSWCCRGRPDRLRFRALADSSRQTSAAPPWGARATRRWSSHVLQDADRGQPDRSPTAVPSRGRRPPATTAARVTVVSRSSVSRTGTGSMLCGQRVGDRDRVQRRWAGSIGERTRQTDHDLDGGVLVDELHQSLRTCLPLTSRPVSLATVVDGRRQDPVRIAGRRPRSGPYRRRSRAVGRGLGSSVPGRSGCRSVGLGQTSQLPADLGEQRRQRRIDVRRSADPSPARDRSSLRRVR